MNKCSLWMQFYELVYVCEQKDQVTVEFYYFALKIHSDFQHATFATVFPNNFVQSKKISFLFLNRLTFAITWKRVAQWRLDLHFVRVESVHGKMWKSRKSLRLVYEIFREEKIDFPIMCWLIPNLETFLRMDNDFFTTEGRVSIFMENQFFASRIACRQFHKFRWWKN